MADEKYTAWLELAMAAAATRLVCTTCRYLRDDVPKPNDQHYLRCGWADGRAVPGWAQWHILRRGDDWMTRQVVQTERGARIPDCPAWEKVDA